MVDQALGLKDYNDLQGVKIFPNPFNQFKIIEYENQNGEHHNLTLFDIHGQQIRAINNIRTNKIRIEKDNLSSGIYFFQLQNKWKTIAKGKLIIE